MTGTSAPLVRRFGPGLATLPGVALGLLPKIACPACWPAWASVFTSLGLGFLLNVRWLFPATAVFLFIAVAALAFRARRRRGFGPFFVGLGASAIVLGGKFGFGAHAAMYAGLPLLAGASIWNTWPKRTAPIGVETDSTSAASPGAARGSDARARTRSPPRRSLPA